MATPLMKPLMTEWGTKRNIEPIFNLMDPLVGVLCGFTGFKVSCVKADETPEPAPATVQPYPTDPV